MKVEYFVDCYIILNLFQLLQELTGAIFEMLPFQLDLHSNLMLILLENHHQQWNGDMELCHLGMSN
jgi:hypothetical protein